MTELAGFASTFQADGFTGYNQLYKGGVIREAACLAHLRRKIFDVHDSQPTELSTTAMAGIQAIYRIEEEIRGLAPAERLAARRRRARPLVRARRQLLRQSKGLSRHADIAKAFAYGSKRWRAFNRFLYDGQLEPDNLIAERAIRGFTVGRRQLAFLGQLRRVRAVSGRAQHHRDVQALRRRCRSLHGRCHRAHPERLASLALGGVDAVELGAPPRDAAPLGGMSAIDDMALSDEALEAWMAAKTNPRPLLRTMSALDGFVTGAVTGPRFADPAGCARSWGCRATS